MLYFFLVKLAPGYIDLETGVGNENLVKAVAKLISMQPKDIKKEGNKLGDLGKVCATLQTATPKLKSFFKADTGASAGGILTLKQVFRTFY